MKSSLKYTVLLFGVITMLTACGGGGGSGGGAGNNGGGGGSGDGGGAAGSVYLFFSGFLGAGSPNPGILFAVDPAKPSSPIAVESGEEAIMGTIRTFRTGTYNGSTQIINDLNSRSLIYAKTDGKFYRIDTLKSGSLAPIQISSENTANQVCTTGPDGFLDETNIVSDFNDLNDSQFVYPLPGADNVCDTGDEEWKMVRLGMGITDTPVTAKSPLGALYEASTGAISGWVVNDVGSLRQCDANFANCSPSIKTIASSAQIRLKADFHRALLQIDNQLFLYDAATKILSPALFSIPASTFISPPITDGKTIFFSLKDSIYHFPADGSALASILTTETTDIGLTQLTTNKVIYQVANEIKSIDKIGGSVKILVSATSGDFLSFSGSKNNVYYSVMRINTSPPFSTTIIEAGIIDENGGNQVTFPKATWAGININLKTLDLNQDANQVFDSAVMILAETNGSSFSGATLKAFDGATAVQGVTLGILPTSDNLSSFNCRGFEHNMLCGATITSPAFQSDMFFVNSLTTNSLARVTNTGGRNEGGIFF